MIGVGVHQLVYQFIGILTPVISFAIEREQVARQVTAVVAVLAARLRSRGKGHHILLSQAVAPVIALYGAHFTGTAMVDQFDALYIQALVADRLGKEIQRTATDFLAARDRLRYTGCLGQAGWRGRAYNDGAMREGTIIGFIESITRTKQLAASTAINWRMHLSRIHVR